MQLVVQGPEPTQQFNSRIPMSGELSIGRLPENELPVPWDRRISRRHARLFLEGGRVTISCIDGARNPIVFRGNVCKSARIGIGDEFQIGATVFRILQDSPEEDSVLKRLLEEDDEEHDNTAYGLSASDRRLTLISQYTQTLWLSSSDEELASGLTNVLAEIIPHAATVAVVRCDEPDRIRDRRPRVLHWEKRERRERLRLSRPMIAAALKKHRTLVAVRRDAAGTGDLGHWVICTPVTSPESGNWCLQITGDYGADAPLPCHLTPDDLSGDVQVAELLAQLAGAIRHAHKAEDRFAGMRQFFSPAVIESLKNTDDDSVLAPTESDTAILFCDLHGYSRIAEQSRHDLPQLLERVNRALGVMTRNIIRQDGVIADFQGDSALGFWGWPMKLENGPLPACRAALKILMAFTRANEQPGSSDLTGFHVGIGLACGEAIAGRIGTKHQAKVGVFGPVVNQGSRLQSMTRQIGVSILVDGETDRAVRSGFRPKDGRVRRIGLIRPAGIDTPIEVSELLPPEAQSQISDAHIQDFDAAVDAFIAGDWDTTRELLSHMPARDRARDFLLMQIARHSYEPPVDWDGVITLATK